MTDVVFLLFTDPVQEHYLEDILQVTGYVPNPGSEYCRRGGGRDRDGNGNNTGPDPAKEVRSFQSSHGQLERTTDMTTCFFIQRPSSYPRCRSEGTFNPCATLCVCWTRT